MELDADAAGAAGAVPAGGAGLGGAQPPVLPEAEQPVREAGQVLFAALLGTGEVAGRYRAAPRWPLSGGRGCGSCCGSMHAGAGGAAVGGDV